MNARLVLISEEAQKIFPIVDISTTVGRAPNNTIQLSSTHVSRHHAVIEMGRNSCEIVDLDSTNGTYVNGQKVTRHTTNLLENGTVIRIGEFEMRFEVDEEPSGGDRDQFPTEIHELSAATIQGTVVKGQTTASRMSGDTEAAVLGIDRPAEEQDEEPANPPEEANPDSEPQPDLSETSNVPLAKDPPPDTPPPKLIRD